MCHLKHWYKQSSHNEYCRNHGIRGGKIRQITEQRKWKGILDDTRGVVYQSNWAPRYNKQENNTFPLSEAMRHDEAYGTYYSFFADKDFTPNVMRVLYKLKDESPFPACLAEYAWQRYVFGNETANSVLLWRCDTGADVLVI